MRTTIDIDLDVLNATSAIAEAESRSLGFVISRLARLGMAPNAIHEASGLPGFSVPEDPPLITAAMVTAALDE
jgi:hypothetical protein